MTPTVIQLGLETTIARNNEERLALAAWRMHKAALRELNEVEVMNPIDVHRHWEDLRHVCEMEKAKFPDTREAASNKP